MVGANKTLAFLFLLIAAAIFLFPSVQAIEADELRAHYAVTLMELAENQDYAIECGPADVLTNPKLLPNVAGYPTDPSVCSMSLTDGEGKATIFSLNAEEAQSTIIEHLKDYYQPDIDNNNHIREEDLDVSACDNAEELDNNWWKCTGAVDSSHSVQLYYRLGQPITYLVTYSFSPSFDQSLWGSVVDFFRNLFGFDAEPALGQDVDAFTRGYFAKETGDGSREIQGFYHAENTDANGDATILFKNFGFNVEEFANGDYQLGVDNTQVLHFDNLAPNDWKKLTARLRIVPNGAEPIEGAVCGDERLDFGEECEPGEGGLTCEDLGFSYGEVTCSDTCQADTSGCFNCEDADGDGYYSEEGLPDELRALNNNIRYSIMDGSYEDIDAFLSPLLVSDFDTSEITQAGRDHLSAFEACLDPSNEKTEYECYQEIDVTQDTSSLSNGLDDELSGEACAYGADCELSAHAFSDQATTYNNLFTDLQSEEVQTMFLLDAGDLALADFGAPPTNQNYETRLELAFTCAGLATITPANNFIYHDKGQSKTQYDRGYQACRAGLNSVGANLYYAKEPHDGLTEQGLIDGIATTKPKKYAGDQTIPETELSYKELLLQNNAGLITINSNILESIEANARYHIDAERSQGNIEVVESLEQTHTSRENEGAATNIVVNTDSGDDLVYISQDTPGLSQDFDYSSCDGTLNKVTQEGIVASEEELENLPAGTFQYQTDWNCFLQDTGVSACTEDAQALDCDDTNSSVNPGQEEICGDGIDNNCNGLIDDNDESCVEDGGSTGESCNFDGYCSPDTEDINTCADCQNACPSERTLMHKQGAYEFYAYITEDGQGQIQIETDGSSGQGHKCDWDGDNNQWFDIFHTQETWTIDFNPYSQEEIQIYDNPANEGTYNAQVYLKPKDGGYQLRFEAQNSGPSKSCWDASSDGANEDLGPVMNPYDHVSCNYSECESQFDCPGENNYCVSVTEQIRTCKVIQTIIPECPPEQDPHPLRPEFEYICP